MKKVLCSLLSLMLFLVSCGSTDRNSENTGSSSANIDKDVKCMDSDILEQMTWDDEYVANVYKLLKSGAGQYAEKYRGEFRPLTVENSNFAPELIYQIQSVLYELCNARLSTETEYKIRYKAYSDMLKNLGAEKYEIDADEFIERFPDLGGEGPRTLVSAFDISDNSDQECYLLVYDNGGTNGACSVCMAEVTNEENVVACRLFETQNEGNGRVINYDDELYYIFQQYNYNLKNYDSIRMHRLGEHAMEDNILIQYLPEDYVWERICYLGLESDWDNELDAYIESIKEEITSDEYLERGLAQEIDLFWGIEEEPVDFMNMGISVYVEKTNFVPSTARGIWCLLTEFYLGEMQEDERVELENLRLDVDDGSGAEVVQMWFWEIDGKVLTFRLYHISDYQYFLNVSMGEEGRMKTLRNYLLVPRRGFVIQEGQVYVNF